jgi:hypothetical protein
VKQISCSSYIHEHWNVTIWPLVTDVILSLQLNYICVCWGGGWGHTCMHVHPKFITFDSFPLNNVTVTFHRTGLYSTTKLSLNMVQNQIHLSFFTACLLKIHVSISFHLLCDLADAHFQSRIFFFKPKFFVQVFWTHQQPLYTLQPFINHRMAAGN